MKFLAFLLRRRVRWKTVTGRVYVLTTMPLGILADGVYEFPNELEPDFLIPPSSIPGMGTKKLRLLTLGHGAWYVGFDLLQSCPETGVARLYEIAGAPMTLLHGEMRFQRPVRLAKRLAMAACPQWATSANHVSAGYT